MKKTNMQRVQQTEYERTILKPLRDAIEKAGGRKLIAKKTGIHASNLTLMLTGDHIMKIPTLMKLCSALNITLLFVDMPNGIPPYTEASYEKSMEHLKNWFRDYDEIEQQTRTNNENA